MDNGEERFCAQGTSWWNGWTVIKMPWWIDPAGGHIKGSCSGRGLAHWQLRPCKGCGLLQGLGQTHEGRGRPS